MNPFQWITLPIVGLLLAADLRGLLFKRPFFRRDRMIRCVIWLAAGVAIYDPDVTAIAANAIGIKRGADLLLYLLVLTFIATSFFFYSRQIQLERTITKIVRYIAIQEAKREARSAANTLTDEQV